MAKMTILEILEANIFFAAQPWWAAILQNTNNHQKNIISVSIDLYFFGQILGSPPDFFLPVRLWSYLQNQVEIKWTHRMKMAK